MQVGILEVEADKACLLEGEPRHPRIGQHHFLERALERLGFREIGSRHLAPCKDCIGEGRTAKARIVEIAAVHPCFRQIGPGEIRETPAAAFPRRVLERRAHKPGALQQAAIEGPAIERQPGQVGFFEVAAHQPHRLALQDQSFDVRPLEPAILDHIDGKSGLASEPQPCAQSQ